MFGRVNHVRRFKRGIYGLATIGLSAGLLMGTGRVAFATQHGEPDTATAQAQEMAATTKRPGDSISVNLPRPTMKPPLPFEVPQVGPVIKRAFSDDVEKRTTAFLPESLDYLTSVKLPTNEKKWIRVDLSEQIVVAYAGNKPVRAFVISSGLPRTPTVTGEYRIKTKVKAQTMSGGEPGVDNYYLPNVKWVQYFYQGYSFHGTYWHNDFGRPKSHGCINMTNTDAKWLFDWAGPTWDGKSAWFHSSKDDPGTLVVVHE